MQEYGVVLGIDTLQQRAKIAIYASYAVIGSVGLMLIGEVLELGGMIDMVTAPDEPLALLYAAVALASIVAFLGSVVVVAMWIYCAHANLHEAGIPSLQNSPGWAVGWYFIPIANLFKPFQVMRELWSESHQVSDSFSAAAPGNLSAWWGVWIVGNILANVSSRLSTMGDGSNAEVALVISILASVLRIAAAWLLIGIIRAITRAQRDGLAANSIFE